MARYAKGTGKTKSVRRERFLRVGAKRVDDLLAAFEKLGTCANPMNYAYEVSELDEMFTEIRKAFDECRDKFSSPPEKPTRARFAFKKAPGE